MGISELEAAWADHQSQIADDYEEWDAKRLEAAPDHLEAMQSFLNEEIDLAELRSRTDSLTKTAPLWGFRGTSQMFFNQLVKAADPGALTTTLRKVLPAPTGPEEAREKLEAFHQGVEATRDNAEAIGATQPGIGRINAFASFFWELQDREQWPSFYPNSRDVLEEQGLLDVNQRQPELYLAYRSVIHDLKETLGTDTWGVEHLLWHLGQGSKANDPAKAATPPSDSAATSPSESEDLYASYRAQGLHFPDEIVTSLVLSLATKRFVILSGISGTGKTQIALGLARYLEATEPAAPDVPAQASDPPQTDSKNIYIKLTAPKLRRGSVSYVGPAREHVEKALGLPERGSSQLYETKLPDGSRHQMRLNNVDFSKSDRTLYRLYFRKDITEWLRTHARPGDFLRFEIKPEAGVDFGLSVVPGAPAQSEEAGSSRHATIAVRSDWTDPRGLIGYFNPLTSSYVRTDLIDLLLKAGEDPSKPYLVILDEMNLARVEYYFSDFLSALESGEALTLMSPGAEEESAASDVESEVELPAEIDIPANVSFVGTVNIDETTHPFSPKVLDRANVIEFSEVDVERALGHGNEMESGGLRLTGDSFDPDWLCASKDASLQPKTAAHESGEFTSALEDIHGILAWSNLHFGYRVIDEVSAFVGHAIEKAEGDPEEVVRRAVDLQIRQKIIPKLSGGRELEEPLARLLSYCLDGERRRAIEVETIRSKARAQLEPAAEASAPRYPGSAEKLLRMLDRLADTGFIGALE
jgi:hypothetical protein